MNWSNESCCIITFSSGEESLNTTIGDRNDERVYE